MRIAEEELAHRGARVHGAQVGFHFLHGGAGAHDVADRIGGLHSGHAHAPLHRSMVHDQDIEHQPGLVHAELVGHGARGVAVVVREVDGAIASIPTLLETHVGIDAPRILVAADVGAAVVGSGEGGAGESLNGQ
ncbi:MAG: hypothetical protein IPG69_18345 [Flavobacteriales bacterium]|nr:hypothetical protein [Flavobacteriales bacterium]